MDEQHSDSREPPGPQGAEVSDKNVIKEQIKELDDFVAEVSAADIHSGNWFARLLRKSLEIYSREVTWEFMTRKYPGLPADVIADRRIELAQRYAMIEGGLSASAYTGLVSATIGSAGGASPLLLPAAATTFALDLAFVSRLQLRLAWDLAVLYRHPINVDDAEDLYDLLRVAFGIKAGEAFRSGLPRLAPEAVRVGVKRAVSGGALELLKGLPVVGKLLLQRNIVKFAIPAVCIPLSMKLNHYMTGRVGEQARTIYRDKAAIVEFAADSAEAFASFPSLALRAMWFVAKSDGTVQAEESWILKSLTDEFAKSDAGKTAIEEFRQIINLDKYALFADAKSAPEPIRRALYDVACSVAAVDREVTRNELASLKELAAACDVPFDGDAIKARAKEGLRHFSAH